MILVHFQGSDEREHMYVCIKQVLNMNVFICDVSVRAS